MAFEKNDEKELTEMFDSMTENVEDIVKLSAMELFRNVILKTPVESGLARGNWNCSLDTPREYVLKTKDVDGSVAMSKVVKAVDNMELGKKIYLTNNLPYIGKIEYGEFTEKDETEKTILGFSKQAPQGMVRISMQEFDEDFSKIVKENTE